ncbi:hypothetical protein ES319_D04G009200v1 [Gossypium barbadense]|uniref:Uncharacterized protein n=1 Tax=Gossypium barbadense TaxID=3634 RepID=A0A5J5RSM2_GOSBA|nr:hypothetical protein ES319_D04G009200v1 [Gossypium barbadense]
MWCFIVKLVEGAQPKGAISYMNFAYVCFVTCNIFLGVAYIAIL